MSCKDNHDKKRNHCVCDVVKFINDLQDCATHTCPTGCDVPFLGANPNVPLANTRPFLLYLANGELFRVPAFNHNNMMQMMAQNRDGNDNQNNNKNGQMNNCQDTVVFRVESVDEDCCAVLRALVPVKAGDGKDNNKNNNQNTFCELVDGDMFVASNTCVTVDLDCFCAIQCLRDVHVTNL
ncbi:MULTISPECIES: CotY/CotZ family spore coat protein [Bacillaceae]|uniref:CotY/CotZ family spore coat protein n=1 Tax=Bacillaceae TaxID=186817 RepID=UPI000BEBBF5A|nr:MULTISPECIES: CotY/CotZ family spore coat protein [unclassified Bacillus (in: firmicutes)]PEC51392.1 spore coat protein [Bacillus sp. AFS096315]PFM78812.1 spore coat protein [Bacillus sp. AFS077874]